MPALSEETGSQPVDVTCPGCFHPQQWDAIAACPICHHRANAAEGRSGALLPVGTQLKGYVIGEKLGQGGFGITYRGFDLTLKIKVAIKEYYPSEMVGRSTNQKAVVLNGRDHEEIFRYGLKTFLKEAQTIAQLRHPHLVRVLNYFELNNTAYLVMDYYEGEDLSRHLKPPKGQPGIKLPWWRAVKLLLPVLDGLQKVHQAGFMHRDLKPGNLYLTKDDELIVLDFGSARQITSNHSHSLLIFSQGYAPYEQYLEGHLGRQGPWTDVYAIAATLYFMVTGSRLPSAMDRKQAVFLQQPDPLKPARHFVPDLPPALDVALLWALAIEAEQRLQSILAFKQHLDAIVDEVEQSLPRPVVVPERSIKPPPTCPSTPETAPKQSEPATAFEATAKSGWPMLMVAITIIGLIVMAVRWWIVDSPRPANLPVAAPPTLNPDHAYLTITTTPATAQIRIINIGSPYRDGIELVPGDFDIEVSDPGYQTYRAWHSLAAGVRELPVVLQREISAPTALPVTKLAPTPDLAAAESFTSEVPTKKSKPMHPDLSGDYVWVAGGCYQMGNEEGAVDERPIHEVCVENFWMGKSEITQSEWRKVMGANPSHFGSGGSYPVENVSWDSVQEFIGRINRTGQWSFRLPTEAEWEYACRSGGRKETYSGSFPIDQVAWYFENANRKTHSVCTKRTNELGLCDMNGNVWEWTLDSFDSSGYLKHSKYRAIIENNAKFKVARGGSWDDKPTQATCSVRGRGEKSGKRYNFVGFRLVGYLNEQATGNTSLPKSTPK